MPPSLLIAVALALLMAKWLLDVDAAGTTCARRAEPEVLRVTLPNVHGAARPRSKSTLEPVSVRPGELSWRGTESREHLRNVQSHRVTGPGKVSELVLLARPPRLGSMIPYAARRA
jgi:hypothetical protein